MTSGSPPTDPTSPDEGGVPAPAEPVVAPVVRRVVLCDRHQRNGHLYEEAAIHADGRVSVTGDDSGSGVEEFFGPDLSDYEWSYDVAPEHIPDLVTMLGGSQGDDVLALIAAHYERHGGAALGELLRADPVCAAFWSYNS